MNTFEYLKAHLTPLTNEPLIQMDEDHARDEWKARNNIRFCNVYAVRNGAPIATVALCTPEMQPEQALKYAVARLGRTS